MVVAGSDFERLGADEWPWVERASLGSSAGCEDGPETAPLCGADGSLLGSGSGGGSPLDEGIDGLADVFIDSAESISLRFLPTEFGVEPGRCSAVFAGADVRLAVGGKPSGLY